MPNTPQPSIKKALILEGGAMRGMFTCGVIDVLLENGIDFDGIAGISAGAAFGCNFKSKQIGRGIRYNKKYCNDPRYCSLRSLIKTGNLYAAEFCYHDIPYLLDPFDRETFKNNPIEFFIGATDVQTGKCLYHQCIEGDEIDIKWMQASASMPLVSRPVSVDGHLLLDGAIADSVPYKFMEERGYNRNLIVLTQPDGYQKNKSKLSPLIKFLLRKYPAMAEATVSRYKMYNKQMAEIKQRENNGTSFVIRPPEALKISRTEHNPSELERVYQIGRFEAFKALPALKRFLTK